MDHPAAPWWLRRTTTLHRVAHAVAALVLVGQLVAVAVDGADLATVLAVLVAGVGVALSWRWPWPGLVVTAAASFAVTAVGRDPLSVWMMAVLVLFSCALRGRRAVLATAVVAAFFLAAYMTVGGFRGGPFGGAAALFSAIAGGASGAALRIYREQWWTLVGIAEAESDRRVTEERLRIARDLHDVVAHQVAMLSVHLGVAEIGLPADAEASREAIGSARDAGRAVVSETQRILLVLRRGDAGPGEEALRPTPSIGALPELVADFEGIGLEVDATIDVPADLETGLETGLGVTVYRVVQEGLTNAYRHGEGPVTLTLTPTTTRHGATFRITIVNRPGPGRPGAGEGGGLGLVGMRERVESAGGRLTITLDGRFRVEADVPVPRAVLA